MNILRTLGILKLSFLRFLFAGKATHAPTHPRKILVVQLAQLGDMVCTTPVFRALKNRYPSSQVVVLGKPGVTQEVLAGNTDVDDYIPFTKEFLRLRSRLVGEKFDAAFIMMPSFFMLATLYCAGIPFIGAPDVVLGINPNNTRTYRLLKRLVWTAPYRAGQYLPRQYLRLLKPLDIHTEDTTKYLAFSDEAASRMDDLLARHGIQPGNRLIAISPTVGNKIKQWPTERFASVADYCTNISGARVVIIGGPKERNEVQEMIGHMTCAERIIDTTEPSLSIEELKALIARCHLLIAVDTGPIYIAEAFNVATVDIVGPLDEHEQPPIGPRHKIVVPQREKPAMVIMDPHSYDHAEARRQAESITANEVIRAINELVN